MTAAVHIVATGARTPLGRGAASSAAAIRATISAVRAHPFLVDQVGELMPVAIDPELDPQVMGPERLIGLTRSALHEVCASLEGGGAVHRLRLPVYLALPEFRPGFSEQDASTVQLALAESHGLPVDVSAVRVFAGGHAAGLAAIEGAARRIQRGELEACLVGGVDSYCQPDTIEWLDENRQLAGTVSRSAFVPGEGAGFCLLMAGPLRERLGLPALARVVAGTVGRENHPIKTSTPCLGEGLTATVHEAVKTLRPPTETVNEVICDVNGERYRGEEWGFVCLRIPEYFDDPAAYLSPADCWGDVGAASGPLFAMLACQAASRGYSKGPLTLLWASSESGLRSAAVLDTGGA